MDNLGESDYHFVAIWQSLNGAAWKTYQYLDLQSGTFTGSGAGLPTPAFFWIWSSCFFPVTLCGFSRLCILCGPHFFEGKPTTDAMILLAKRAGFCLFRCFLIPPVSAWSTLGQSDPFR